MANLDQKTMLEDLAGLPVVQSLAQTYLVTADAMIGTFASVAMPSGYTKGELISCLLVAKEHGLNPLTKEIYFMRTKGNQIQPIVGVDGWIRKCNEHDQFDGIEFEDVRDANGNLTALTCIIHRKDRKHPIRVTEDLAECSENGGAVWKKMPKRMLRNRALCQAARVAFGFAGIMEPDEFFAWQASEPGTMKDVTPKRKSSAAAKRDGDDEAFNDMRAAIQAAPTTVDLRELFTDNADGNTPWHRFPARWAELLQEDFDARYDELSAAEEAVAEA